MRNAESPVRRFLKRSLLLMRNAESPVRRFLKRSLLLAAVCLLFAVMAITRLLRGDPAPIAAAPIAAAPIADWTILIYGHGDHDLAVGLVDDLLEMEKVGSSDRFQIIVQTDFDASQEEDLVEAGLPQSWIAGSRRVRFERAPKGATTLQSKVLESLPEQNMDDPETLAKFLSWAMAKYPSRRVGLVLTDHGDQWYGFGGDTQDGELEETGEISLTDLGKTLQKTLQLHRAGKPFDFLALDCCLMGSAEVLSELHPYCQLLIASAEIDYGYGLDYEATLQWLKDHPDASMTEFGKVEVNAWKAHQFRKDEPAPGLLGSHACYDCTKGPELEKAIGSFTAALLEQPTIPPRFVPVTRRTCTEYGLEPTTLGQPSDYVDLGEFASKMAASPTAPAKLREKAAALAALVDRLVLLHAKGELRAGATGLSIWYPPSGRPKEMPAVEPGPAKRRKIQPLVTETPEETFAKYRKIRLAQTTGWPKWLDRIQGEAKKAREITVKLAKKVESNGLTLTQGKASTLRFTLGKARTAWKADLYLYSPPEEEDSDDWTELGWISKVQVEGNGRYELPIPAKIPCMMLADGKTKVPLGAESVNGDGTLLASKFLYFPPKMRGHHEGELISILWTRKGDAIRPLVAITVDEEGGSIAEAVLKPGGKIVLMRSIEIREGDDPYAWETELRRSDESFVIPPGGVSGLKAEWGPLPLGEHELLLAVDDVYGLMGGAERIDLKVVQPK